MYSLIAQIQSLFNEARDCTGTFTRISGTLCTFQDFLNFIYNLVQFAVVVLAPAATIAVITYGAFQIMFYGANNPDGVKKGKAAIVDAVLGLLVVWGAWAIVNTTFYIFNIQLPCGAHWYEITPSC